ncbi:hypothetical protein [Deinococcus sp.]|uniref:hypothetical protein n=1 Tax=Deinococcus sp. TaxID=47478 RepID=UPI0025FA4B96|nr:hypothetical protein [Deinococcus sp.]
MLKKWISIWFAKSTIPIVLTTVIVVFLIGGANKLEFWAFIGWYIVVAIAVELALYLVRSLIKRLNGGKLSPAVDRWL